MPPPPPPPHLLKINLSWLLPLVLLLLLNLFSPALCVSVITHLPGFRGRLPFYLETGYVSVDEEKGVELFYYFIASERSPSEDPVLLWLTGGPGCSAFSGLVDEIGPIKFVKTLYNGSLPNLVYFPHSWTKVANIIFLDSPVGTGFSFSASPEGYYVGDLSSSMQVHSFITKWFIDHPQFLSNPFYVSGDSYAGKLVPLIAQIISEGTNHGKHLVLNLKGYLIGNPATGEKIDKNSRVPYAHGVGIISDQIFELVQRHCAGEDYEHPCNVLCAKILDTVDELISNVQTVHILEPKCPRASPKPKSKVEKMYVGMGYRELLGPPEPPSFKCRTYVHLLNYYWANSKSAQEALHVKKPLTAESEKQGTVREWQRCNDDLRYTKDLHSSIKHHLNLTSRGYRALVYSGDHDLVVPFLGTQEWVRSLNFPIVSDWRSWNFGGQSAG